MRNGRFYPCGCFALAAIFALVMAEPAAGSEASFREAALPIVKQFCFDCHAGATAEANLDLEKLIAAPAFESGFKQWQKVAAAVEQGKMPPKDAASLSAGQRAQLTGTVRGELKRVTLAHAADPGEVILRRLSSAEYAYTIQDLTGLDLALERDFVSDAVGGEGFTNVGSAQFVQDSTLERYLEAAKRVASHAVIGAGPLSFFRDPGKTGLELSAMHRIQEIYRSYGFRTSAGEGAEPYGLDRYAKAFFAAWRYRHRAALGIPNATLASVAADEEQQPKFVAHIWSVVNAQQPTFPTAEFVATWQALPVPVDASAELQSQVRAQCGKLYQSLAEMQRRLAAAVNDEEEAPILSERSLSVVKSQKFSARLILQPDTKAFHVQFSALSADPGSQVQPVVIWRNPGLRFRRSSRRRDEPEPLSKMIPAEAVAQFQFGVHPAGTEIAPGDFVTRGAQTRSFEMQLPPDGRGAEFVAEVELDLASGDDCVVRCEITGAEEGLPKRPLAAALLADPNGQAFARWQTGVLEFARLLPQVSHREPAPSDRDPIPFPFDNTYNMPERNFFHTRVKYHRDDAFLGSKMLDRSAQKALNEAWADLLGSFEYHDIVLRFAAEKFQFDLGGRSAADLANSMDEFPDSVAAFMYFFLMDVRMKEHRWRAAEERHVEDAVQFASRAWRRSLADEEKVRLRSFYAQCRSGPQQSHDQAVRSLLVRILTAPDFLYRAERPVPGDGRARVGNYEIASRLSYFLWSSLPDEELLRLAEEGYLREPQQLAKQARRMLADPKARRLATEFFGQWLGFYQFDRHRGIDAQRFPEFDEKLKAAMYDEAITFCEHIVREDRPVSEILFADYAYMNSALVKHYGAEEQIEDAEMSRVENAGRYRRGGLLGLGAVLTVTSAPLRTSPVKRGDWVLRRILGTPVPPPPADVGSIPADDVLPSGPRTVRERLESHRRDATCNNCHSRIDALGFALENYDPLGRWREQYRDGAMIDSSGTLQDGTHLSGTDSLRKYLREQQPLFERTLCTKLAAYALGRGESVADQKLIEEMQAAIATGNDRFSNLIVKIVTSPQFRYHQARESQDHVSP